MIVYEESLFNKTYIFKNRFHAGKQLSELVSKRLDLRYFSILAIPAGGVPVGYEMAKYLGLKLRLILVSKILFPWTTEAGFGAISMYGVVRINEDVVDYLGLKEEVIRKQVEECRRKIEKRQKIIEKISRKFFEYDEQNAILVDDGLAPGFTMLVAIESARKFFEKIFVAVPTASLKAIDLIRIRCDGIFCANLRDFYPYAVADAYQEWHDVSEEEMLGLLEEYVKSTPY